jgi:hypothetical protein
MVDSLLEIMLQRPLSGDYTGSAAALEENSQRQVRADGSHLKKPQKYPSILGQEWQSCHSRTVLHLMVYERRFTTVVYVEELLNFQEVCVA